MSEYRMTRDEIVDANPLDAFLESRGCELRRAGSEMACLCPLHEDKSPSFRVNLGKKTWYCDPCGVGGSIIDLVMRLDGLSMPAAIAKLAGSDDLRSSEGVRYGKSHNGSSRGDVAPMGSVVPTSSKLVKTYDYADSNGALLYQVCRYEPKTFRQRHKVNGEWVWKMEGVRLVLYGLPAVKAAEYVWILEGEKDADTLNGLGAAFCATCNVGGAGKWLDSYSQTLRGKEVILCGDNDEPGRKHIAKVQESLAGIAKTTRVVTLPGEFKDAAEFVASFASKVDAGMALLDLAEAAEVLVAGVRVPVRSMAEMEREYQEFAKRVESVSLSFSHWLPTFGGSIRPLVPGELVTFLAATGVGKTMLLQNLARSTRLTTLLFEMELPDTLTFERFVSIETQMSGQQVADAYRTGNAPKWKGGKLDHIHVCSQSKLTIDELEKIIEKAGLKIGHRPQLVLIDYVQLLRGTGSSRYERMSSVAEELKIMAKATKTIVVIASQIARPAGQESLEVTLHDGKDSGSIENSSGLVIGAWRDAKERCRMWLRVLKNTKGVSGNTSAVMIGSDLMLTEYANP